MKPFAKLMIVAMLVAGIGVPMIMKGPNGKPIMTLNDWLPDFARLKPQDFNLRDGAEQLKSLANITGDGEPTVESSVKTAVEQGPPQFAADSGKMYKWQDEKGRWHFSSEKPKETAEVSVESLPEVENFMQPPVKTQENSSSIGLPGGSSL